MKAAGSTKLVVDCTECGQVRVAPGDVTIRNCVETDDWSYWFVCPSCRRRSAAMTGRQAALAAIAAGSPLAVWAVPAEVNERPDGPPLTVVDLLDLCLLLIEPDWIDQLG